MIRHYKPGDLAALPADQQIDVPIKDVRGRHFWYEVANESPYVFELQDDTQRVRAIIGAFKYKPVRINPLTNQLTLHAIATVAAAPIPAVSWAVYGGITQSPDRPHSLAEGSNSASVVTNGDPGDGIAAPNMIGVESLNWIFNGATWARLRAAVALDVGLAVGVLTAHAARILDTAAGTLTTLQDKSLATIRNVSALNTQQQFVIELRNLAQRLAIVSVASAGTATLVVEGSVDNANWITVDSIAAALTQAKDYSAATVGATTAVSPLAFRYLRVTAGAAGAGNSTTLTVSTK